MPQKLYSMNIEQNQINAKATSFFDILSVQFLIHKCKHHPDIENRDGSICSYQQKVVIQ
ncbi:MAG: hypothetical protein KAS18_08820 [Calditrichia bacterium]|nr:hypothetical protein [Calditrichia bacterium]